MLVEVTIPPEEQGAWNELKMLRAWAESLEKSEENYGIIHYDFELDNLR